jgi:hypothetical protein
MAADTPGAAAERSPTAHAGYVRQVAATLADHGIDTDNLEISARQKRTASMKITERDPFGAIGKNAEWIMLHWDEGNGWSYQVQYPGDKLPRGRVFFGFSAVPVPGQIATWLTVSLAHPEIEPNHEDGPFDTPDMEGILRTYSATAR